MFINFIALNSFKNSKCKTYDTFDDMTTQNTSINNNLSQMSNQQILQVPTYTNGMNDELNKYYTDHHAKMKDSINNNENVANATQVASISAQETKNNNNANTVVQKTSDITIRKPKIKNDRPERNTTKFIIYHMDGCGHCLEMMEHKQSNGKTKYQTLIDTFKNDNNVEILDFQLGRDREADKFNSFPTIYIVTPNKSIEYNGSRDLSTIIRTINNIKQQ
jgi:hypothetical protein